MGSTGPGALAAGDGRDGQAVRDSCLRAFLTRVKQPNWRMAKEVTRWLRAFDPDDPVKYDFALCRLGVLKQPIPAPSQAWFPSHA